MPDTARRYMTVEFWFKIDSVGYKAERNHIFSLLTENRSEVFFEIGIDNNILICYPFGTYKDIPFG